MSKLNRIGGPIFLGAVAAYGVRRAQMSGKLYIHTSLTGRRERKFEKIRSGGRRGRVIHMPNALGQGRHAYHNSRYPKKVGIVTYTKKRNWTGTIDLHERRSVMSVRKFNRKASRTATGATMSKSQAARHAALARWHGGKR